MKAFHFLFVWALCFPIGLCHAASGPQEKFVEYKEAYAKQRALCSTPQSRLDLDGKYDAALQKLQQEGAISGDSNTEASIQKEREAVEGRSGEQRRALKSNQALYAQTVAVLTNCANTAKGATGNADNQQLLMACRKEIADLESKLAKLPKDNQPKPGTYRYETTPAGAVKRVVGPDNQVVEETTRDSAGRISSRRFADDRQGQLQLAQQGAGWRGKLHLLKTREQELLKAIESAKKVDEMFRDYKRRILAGESIAKEQMEEGYSSLLPTSK